jgi:predicted nuclease of restriction endonuclease-like (RecB) superfamily
MSENNFINYSAVLHELKQKIKQARVRAFLSVNKELLQTYWDIGCVIAKQENAEGWGAGIVKSLSRDLKLEFPDMQGISPRNLRYMRDFAMAYPYFPILQAPLAKLENKLYSIDSQRPIILQAPPAKLDNYGFQQGNHGSSSVQAPLAQLTWYHHQTLLDKVKDPSIRQFYILKTIENGWSRNVMVHQIESGLHNRQGGLLTNFNKTIAPEQSELLQQLFKDPYNFDFLQMTDRVRERDLENALIQHIKKFLLELGDGFAFMGQQYRLWAGENEYIIDLLFYHTKLRRHIIIDLKVGNFEAEFVSKMNLYLGIADDTLKGVYDESAIGLILCKTKDKVIAEYALRDTIKPIGISEYKIAEALPDNIKGELPSIEELEQKMDEELLEGNNPIDARLKAVKQKLNKITNEEIQTPVTFPILTELYKKELRPLYLLIIEKFTDFKDLFYDQCHEWYHGNKRIENLQQLDGVWNDENEMQKSNEIFFDYRLFGFRKAGTENYSAQIRLRFEINTYWYGFSLLINNDHQLLFKKLYHQGLNDEDNQHIIDYITNNMLDQIEWIVRRLEEKLHPVV